MLLFGEGYMRGPSCAGNSCACAALLCADMCVVLCARCAGHIEGVSQNNRAETSRLRQKLQFAGRPTDAGFVVYCHRQVLFVNKQIRMETQMETELDLTGDADCDAGTLIEEVWPYLTYIAYISCTLAP